jgi:hypothetical protein
VLHRAGNLPAVIHPDGTQEFWEHGDFIGVELGPSVRSSFTITFGLNRDNQVVCVERWRGSRCVFLEFPTKWVTLNTCTGRTSRWSWETWMTAMTWSTNTRSVATAGLSIVLSRTFSQESKHPRLL